MNIETSATPSSCSDPGNWQRPAGTIHQELGWIWRLEDGKVLAMTNYLGHRETLNAAGLDQ